MTMEEVKNTYENDIELLFTVHAAALVAIDNLQETNRSAIKAIEELEGRLIATKQCFARSQRYMN